MIFCHHKCLNVQEKYEQAVKCSDIIHVVTPDWLVDSVRTLSLCAEILYHPRLLVVEKPQLKSGRSMFKLNQSV